MIFSKDILWKSIIEDFFKEFLFFFYPEWVNEVDFDKGFEFLDKELEQLFPDSQSTHRFADKLVKVYTKKGIEHWVLIHIEVQGYHDKDFAERMFIYYYRIYDRYRKKIAALAIYTDDSPSFHPTEFSVDFLNTKLRYEFDTYKLYNKTVIDFDNQKNNPFAIIMEIAWAELHTKGNLDELHNKTEIARKLLAKGFNKKAIERLLNFLRYYFRLHDKKKECIFEDNLHQFTKLKKTAVPMGIEEAILTDAKRQGLEQGIEQGIEQNQKNFVKKLLIEGFSIEKIHQMFKLPLDFIIKIKEEAEL